MRVGYTKKSLYSPKLTNSLRSGAVLRVAIGAENLETGKSLFDDDGLISGHLAWEFPFFLAFPV